MAVEIVMPRMGLTMEAGTVVAWLKEEGQEVSAGEPLLEIETDKSTVEIEAPAGGVLVKILSNPGATVPVGSVIGYLGQPEERTILDTALIEPESPTSLAQIKSDSAAQEAIRKVKASPAARQLAQKLKVDLAEAQATGPGGRVVAWNVQALAHERLKEKEAPVLKVSPVAQRVATDRGIDLSQVSGSGPGGWIKRADVERFEPGPQPAPVVPLSRQQQLMAERMTASFSQTPHFYLHVEADARRLAALRERLLPRLEAGFGVHLTYTDLLVKFCALTLVRHPRLMAQWAEGGLRQQQEANIGVAVDTQNGLIVPVIRAADRLGLVEIAQQRATLIDRARTGKLMPQDLELGVFTITNLGAFGIDSFDAILNPPQAAILAVGRIKERAFVENGQLIPALLMNLSLSVDHRVLDGASGARFLGDLVEMIETPDLALA